MIDIEKFFGTYVRVELDSGLSHQGILEEVNDTEIAGYVRIKGINELFLFPIEDIVNISSPQLH
ncbi:hypothetical protein [Paenibacillus sp. MMO-58]|uniref:hypothetical protein n=1 Tax=Paenibacillus sp. MMO-58 TaxID=3081290 RepID=UPI0030178D53